MLARMIPVMALVAGLVATGAGADGTARTVAAANGSSVFDVRDFGATGDGRTLDTEAIAKAIRAPPPPAAAQLSFGLASTAPEPSNCSATSLSSCRLER